MQPPTRRRRNTANATGITAKLLVMGLVASIAVLAPTPHAEAREVAVVDTRTPPLQTRAADPGGYTAATAPATDPTGAIAAELAEPGRRVAAETVAPFDLLGVTAPAGSTGHILARARTDGRWSPWMHLEVNPDHRPEGREGSAATRSRPGLHTEPAWFGGADAYEVSAPAGVGQLQVHLVRPVVEAVTVSVTEASAGAAATASAPPVLSRSAWGARPPAVTPSVAPDLKIAVVHHSVNANTYTSAEVPALLRSIQAYHMDVQGWNDIAYNFAVDRFGRLWEARAGGITKAVIGGHAQGFNTYSTGVVVLGDFTSAQPAQGAVNAVADVIGWKFALHQLEVRGSTQFTSLGGPRYAAGTVVQLPRIVGHRDVGQTGCPGSLLYSRLDEIRIRAASRFDSYIAQQPEDPLFGDFDGDGLRDVLRYRPGSTADVLWSHPGTATTATPLVVGGVYRPVVADLDGDRRDDVLWYAPGSSPKDRIWYGGPTGFTSVAAEIPEQGLPAVAELDGDGVADVVVYAPGPSPDRIYSGRRNRTLVALPLAVDATQDLSVGDLDGDGRDDLFWYGYGSNDDSRYFSDGGGGFTVVATSTASGSSIPVLGDFDGNGQHDILFYGPGSAPDELWWSTAGARGAHTVQSLTVRGATYQPQVGDVDGNGSDDVLWYQPGSGGDPLWRWSSRLVRTDTMLSVGGAYVPDLGRYTPDPMEDVAWMSPTGVSHLWIATGNGTFRSISLG